MDVDNNEMVNDLLNFLLIGMAIVSWACFLFCIYKISTLQLQDPVTVNEVDEIVENDDAKDILRQLRINIETEDQLIVTE